MIRLVQQFDDPRTRPSAAAPKSEGCCCCCCCCLATMVGASVLTARSVGKGFKPRAVGALEVEAPGPAESVFRPSGPDVPVPNVRTIPKTRWKVLGFFLLPLSIILPIPLFEISPAVAFTMMIALYVGGLFLLRHKAGLRGWVFAVLLLGIPVMTVIEAFVWAFAILK
ncbi:MAG TPA: hypothetical protein VFF06_13535 [Polyangia bacterium]|nr:hypothetical protein [Polyangia bacterium]